MSAIGNVVLMFILLLSNMGVTLNESIRCSCCRHHCKPKVTNVVWYEPMYNRTNTTTLEIFLSSAPCPPVWNLTLSLVYFTRTNMSCDQSVYILERCLEYYTHSLSCEQTVDLLKTCLVLSKCSSLHTMLTEACSRCPQSCTDDTSSSSNHSQSLFFDDTVHDDFYESSGNEYETSTVFSMNNVITDKTTVTSSTLSTCDKLCLSIVLPLLLIFILGVIISIMCVCRKGKRKRKKTISQIPQHDRNAIHLRKVRPCSYQDELTPKAHVTINRSRSAGWNHEPLSRLSGFQNVNCNHGYYSSNSFKIV